jgi:hypothetical protein
MKKSLVLEAITKQRVRKDIADWENLEFAVVICRVQNNSESESRYDRRSVGQSVLVSDRIGYVVCLSHLNCFSPLQ